MIRTAPAEVRRVTTSDPRGAACEVLSLVPPVGRVDRDHFVGLLRALKARLCEVAIVHKPENPNCEGAWHPRGRQVVGRIGIKGGTGVGLSVEAHCAGLSDHSAMPKYRLIVPTVELTDAQLAEVVYDSLAEYPNKQQF